MEAERFAQLLSDHHSLQQLSYQELERAVMEHPFCQTMRFLLLKKVQMDDHPASQKHLELAATYAPDRAHLYAFLNGLIYLEDNDTITNLEDLAEPEDSSNLPEPEDSKDLAEPSHLEETLPQTGTDVLEPMEHLPEGALEEQEEPLQLHFVEELVVKADSPEDQESIAPSPEEEPQEKEKQELESLDLPNLETMETPKILKSAEKSFEPEEESIISSAEAPEHIDPLEEVMDHPPVELDQKSEKEDEVTEVFEHEAQTVVEEVYTTSKFVQWLKQKDQTIRPETPKDDPKLKEAVTLAEQSVEAESAPLTETLAKILSAQGNKTQAIEVYQKLSLKFPEKSGYFAALIKELEN
ncbi:MAG: hypothetical protein AAF598_09590 [Bacteroidota bacterium]